MTDFNPEAFYELALENDGTNDGFLSSSDHQDHYNTQFAKDCTPAVTLSSDEAHEARSQVHRQVELAEKDPEVIQKRRQGFFIAIGVNGLLSASQSMRELKRTVAGMNLKSVIRILYPIN